MVNADNDCFTWGIIYSQFLFSILPVLSFSVSLASTSRRSFISWIKYKIFGLIFFLDFFWSEAWLPIVYFLDFLFVIILPVCSLPIESLEISWFLMILLRIEICVIHSLVLVHVLILSGFFKYYGCFLLSILVCSWFCYRNCIGSSLFRSIVKDF